MMRTTNEHAKDNYYNDTIHDTIIIIIIIIIDNTEHTTDTNTNTNTNNSNSNNDIFLRVGAGVPSSRWNVPYS